MLKNKRKFKIIKKIFLVIVLTSLIVVVGTIIYYRASMIKDIRVEDGNIVYKETFIKRKKHELKEVIVTHKSKEFDLSDINIMFDGKILDKEKMFELNQRYYIPLEKILKGLNINYEKESDSIYKINDVNLDLSNRTYIQNGDLQKLRGDIITKAQTVYISLNDLENIIKFTDKWSYDDKTITLYPKDEDILKTNRNEANGKAAMIRLEDVSNGNRYNTDEGIQSIKALCDYLYKNGVVYNVAWIPRFKDPGQKIDNNLLTDRSMGNAQFVNMLDYMIYRGGAIGLHGYTHQSGADTTAIGSDLSVKINKTENETRKVVESSIETAKVLNIPYSFFESGHYHASKKQQAIIEEYVDVCFEPYKIYWNLQPVLSKRNDSTLYVPAPLSYSTTEDGSDIAKKIMNNKKRKNILTGFFLHPTKVMDYFNTNYDTGKAVVTLKENSAIENIVNALNESNHVTVNINDLK